MHIGIDGNLLCGKKTGMGTVACSILKYWKTDGGNKITVFVPERLDYNYQENLETHGISIKICGKANYFVWEQIVLPKAVKKENVDVLWCPYNTAPLVISCATVVTVHDIIYMTQPLKSAPTWYKKAGIIYRRFVVPKAINRSKKVITISQYAQSVICSSFPSATEKIRVIYNSADINTSALDIEAEKKFFKDHNITVPYILGFGSLEPRKNSIGLIKAYSHLPADIREKYQLVLFGFRGFGESADRNYIQEKHIKGIVVLGYVSDKEKNTLYRNSEMFVFPTSSEGFGIPVLEAYANSTPVITSNVTSIPEVAGDAAILVDPERLDQIKTAIIKLAMNAKLREELILKGKRQLTCFDWEKSSEHVMSVVMETKD